MIAAKPITMPATAGSGEAKIADDNISRTPTIPPTCISTELFL